MVLATLLSSQVLTSVSAVTTSAQTESVTTASTKTADATKNVADTSKDTAGKVDPRGLDLFVWGTTSYSGSAVNGLTINNSVTSGTLSLQLDIQSLADISWKNNSSFAIKLPDEFAELSKTEAFKQSLSGSFKFTTFGIGGEDYTYRAADVTVENNQIVFRNPDITGVFGVLPHVKMIVNMDLGKAVTQSGVRIANARNMSYYDFQTALNSYGNVVDWNLGSTNSHAKIPVQKMDPGFDDTAPEIRTEYKNLNVELNSVYNDTAALKDITVYDKEDGYINNKLIVESNQVDTSREGDYDVTYSATDSIGIKTVKTLTMHVKKTVPETSGTIAPKDYTVGEQNITGSFTGDVSQIELYVNGIRKSNGGSFSDGKFIYNVGDQNLKSTDHVTMNAYDRTGKILQKDVVVNVKDVVTVGAIAPNDYTVGDSSITGNFTGDVKQIALYINGNRVSETGPFSNGRFTYNVSEEHIKATDKVTMNAYDQKGKLLQKDVVVHVKNKVVVTAGTITPSDYTVGQTEVKGQNIQAIV